MLDFGQFSLQDLQFSCLERQFLRKGGILVDNAPYAFRVLVFYHPDQLLAPFVITSQYTEGPLPLLHPLLYLLLNLPNGLFFLLDYPQQLIIPSFHFHLGSHPFLHLHLQLLLPDLCGIELVEDFDLVVILAVGPIESIRQLLKVLMAASEIILQFLVFGCEGIDLLVGFFADFLDVFEDDLQFTVGDVGLGVRGVEFGGCEGRAGRLFGGRGVCDLCGSACGVLALEGLLSLAHYNDNMAEEYRLTPFPYNMSQEIFPWKLPLLLYTGNFKGYLKVLYDCYISRHLQHLLALILPFC